MLFTEVGKTEGNEGVETHCDFKFVKLEITMDTQAQMTSRYSTL